MTNDLSIQTEQLGREYRLRGVRGAQARSLTALAGVDLSVRRGELFGLLGPNGAGKTTLIKILTTLLAPTTGRARVAGHDVQRETAAVRSRINMVSGGESSGYGLLTVEENLWMFSQFYGIPSKAAKARIAGLLEVVGLADRAKTKCSELSTGLRQKMNIVRGFLTDPEVLFLDEPSLGLDVGAARDVRRFVQGWMAEDTGRTLLLTTHDMIEADALCRRVAIISRGRVLACDTPAALRQGLRREALFHLVVAGGDVTAEAVQGLPGVRSATVSPGAETTTLELRLAGDDALGGVLAALTGKGLTLVNLGKREATLEDVFVALVGQSMEEVEKSDAPAGA
jgi:ABC-2 type transport system ATP-binding protein